MTDIYTKKDFIKMLQKAIAEDAIIAMTRDRTRGISSNLKRNSISVTFAYAADAFDHLGDIRVFLESPVISFIICKPERMSEKARNAATLP